MSLLAQQLLAHMQGRLPVQQLYRLHELHQLAPPEVVDRALEELALSHQVGSPAPGLWFPLRPVEDEQGVFYMPPAFLLDMAKSLLEREGVGVRPGISESQYRRGLNTDGREGGWGTPTFQQIGVDQPVALELHWHWGHVYTEYEGHDMTPDHPLPFSATEIFDMAGLARRAEQLQIAPARMEKDVRVNAALLGLSEAPLSGLGMFLFMGGTCLTKVFRLLPRFSEDVDLRFQLHESTFPGTFADLSAAVYEEARAKISDHVLPRIPGSRIDERRSSLRPESQLHTFHIQYPAGYGPKEDALRLEIALKPWRVPWDYQAIQSFPGTMADQPAETLGYLPCVPIWATMTGKLQALAMYGHSPKQRDMRHLADLGAWLSPERETGDIHGYMVQQSLQEGHTEHLLDWLYSNLNHLRSDPAVVTMYASYVREMFPGALVSLAPPFHETLDRIENLWQTMCSSDWDHPRYQFKVPHVQDVPAPLFPPRLQPPDTSRLRQATESARGKTEGDNP